MSGRVKHILAQQVRARGLSRFLRNFSGERLALLRTCRRRIDDERFNRNLEPKAACSCGIASANLAPYAADDDMIVAETGKFDMNVKSIINLQRDRIIGPTPAVFQLNPGGLFLS